MGFGISTVFDSDFRWLTIYLPLIGMAPFFELLFWIFNEISFCFAVDTLNREDINGMLKRPRFAFPAEE